MAKKNPAPTMAEELYAERIATGHAPMPQEGDKTLTSGVKAALANRKAAQAVEAKSDNLSDLVVSPEFAGKIGIDLTANIETRWAAVRAHEEHGKARFAAMGLLLLSLKNDMPHGQFLPELERRGFEERQARRAMAYAEYVFSQPQKQQSRLLEMPVAKVAALAQADPEVVEALMSDGETVEQTTVRDLVEEIKALKKREANYDAELELAKNNIKRLTEAKRLTSFQPRTEELRAECMALQLGGELHLNSLRKLFDDTDIRAPEGQLQIEHVWIAANALAARAYDLTYHILTNVPRGTKLPERPHGNHILTPEEAEAWLLNYPLIENRYAAETASRQEKREAAKPRGRGRPAGAKNKKAARA
jgi:hypothetical protein